jgi:glycosyltransferase involved in cell wall biosynthesis
MPVPHCLVFEPDVAGHRSQHVRHLTDALLAIGCRVSLVLQTDARDRTEYHVHLQPLEPQVEIHLRLDPRQRSDLRTPRRRVRELLETIADVSPDWAYVPYADRITQAAALQALFYGNAPFRRVPIEAQIMRGRYGYPRQSTREAISAAGNRWLTQRSPWRVTHVLDPFALRGLEPLPSGSSFRLIPEPVEPMPALDRSAAREALGIPTDGRYLAFVGGAHPSKGIDLLLAAFARAELAADDRLLFVGKMSPSIREQLHREHDVLLRRQRIAVVDRFVSDFELDCGFLAADVVAVTHPRQIGSSGTLVRAAAAQRPVLASDFGWIAWATNTFALGTTVHVPDRDSFTKGIEQAFTQSTGFQPSAASRRFCQYHTVANQKAHWVADLSHERGIPTSPIGEKIDWQWVMESVEG